VFVPAPASIQRQRNKCRCKGRSSPYEVAVQVRRIVGIGIVFKDVTELIVDAQRIGIEAGKGQQDVLRACVHRDPVNVLARACIQVNKPAVLPDIKLVGERLQRKIPGARHDARVQVGQVVQGRIGGHASFRKWREFSDNDLTKSK
jgi:hypothetical protein